MATSKLKTDRPTYASDFIASDVYRFDLLTASARRRPTCVRSIYT